MLTRYHRQITQTALQSEFSSEALKVIIRTNIGQDGLRGQVGHPEFHFDDNQFSAGQNYLAEQRGLVLAQLQTGQFLRHAWEAFGRLTHAAQDFYAHTTYVRIWHETHPASDGPDQITCDDQAVLASPALKSGHFYLPFEPFSMLPWIGKYVKNVIPRDSHAWMNLDSPGEGPLFAYAQAAAVQRTRQEFHLLVKQIGEVVEPASAVQRFRGKMQG
jgi:hypothetical protein